MRITPAVHPLSAVRLAHGPLGFEDQTEDGSTPARFELPEEMPKSSEDLRVLRDEAEAAFLAAHTAATDGGKKIASEDDLAELARLGDAVDTIEAAAAEVEAEEQARQAKADELFGKVVRPDEEAQSGTEGGEGDESGTDGGDGGEGGTEGGEGGEGADSQQKEDALVAGAGKRPAMPRSRTSFRGAGAGSGNRVPENRDSAPELGFVLSQSLRRGRRDGLVDTMAIAEASDANHPGRVREVPGGGSTSLTLATMTRPFAAENVVDETTPAALVAAAIDRITDEKQIKEGADSLVAAGGWCAPSEIVYNFLGVPAAGDLIDVPELGISRGGIRFPVQPDFGMAFNQPGFLYTEAEAIAQTEDKPCFEVPCVGFDEVRLDAIGLCITAGLLQNKGFPEVVREYIDGILVGHQHRISSYTIQKMLAKVDKSVTIPTNTVLSAFDGLLNAVELAQIDISTRARRVYGSTIEIVLPTWARPALRADLARRRGVDVNVVTDAQLDAHFANRKVRPQFVSDWQTGGTGQPGSSTPITKLPDTIEFLAYPAGTYFRSQSDVIEVGNLYDQAQLKRNRYTALFTEDGIAVGKRGLDSRRYTVPLEYTGAVGQALPLDNGATAGA